MKKLSEDLRADAHIAETDEDPPVLDAEVVHAWADRADKLETEVVVLKAELQKAKEVRKIAENARDDWRKDAHMYQAKLEKVRAVLDRIVKAAWKLSEWREDILAALDDEAVDET